MGLAAPVCGRTAAALLSFLLACGDRGQRALHALDSAIATAAEALSLRESRVLLDELLRRGRYQDWVREGPPSAAILGRALMRVRSGDPQEDINRAWEKDLEPSPSGAALLIVPGLNTAQAGPLAGTLRRRCRLAFERFQAGDAPRVLCSGAAMDPNRPEAFEGLAMREELLRLGLPPERVGVELRARHTTTNLRNCGRLMLRRGWTEALVVTTPLQAFYIGVGALTGFRRRCSKELGYRLGDFQRIDRHRCRFAPDPKVRRINERDPLDP